MANKDIFCNSPWYELHIYWDGSLAFCCHATPAVPYESSQRLQYNIKNMSISEWYNSEPMQQARQHMLSDVKWDHCQPCHYEECVSNTSRRMRSNQKSVIFTKENFKQSFEQSPGYTKFINPTQQAESPVDLHIDLGNYCNLACKMCNPLASSKIASQHKAWKLIDTISKDWTSDQKVWDRFLAELLTIPKLKNLHFMGGETFIQPRFEECIDFLINNKRTDLCISLVTNGTVFNPGLVQKLKQFSRVGLEVSIETLSDTNSYIRQGTNTTLVVENINRYMSECNGTNITLTLRPAPGLLSARDYWQVIQFALENQLIIKSNICNNPIFLSVPALPLSIRTSYIDNYKKLSDQFVLTHVDLTNDYNQSNPHNYKLTAKNQIDQMIGMLTQPDLPSQNTLMTQLVQHLQKWDQVYKYDARTLYPELDDILTKNGYNV